MDAFGYDVKNVGKGYDFSKKPKSTSFKVDEIKADFVKDEKGNVTGDTVGVVSGFTDLEEVIRSYKDQTGLAYILREVASGRRSLDSLADDVRKNGDYGGDFTNPTMAAEAYQAMKKDAEASEQLKSIARSIGVSTDELLKCKDLKALIASKVSAPSNEGGNE